MKRVQSRVRLFHGREILQVVFSQFLAGAPRKKHTFFPINFPPNDGEIRDLALVLYYRDQWFISLVNTA
ncbi:hypothetical protein M2152_000579 [Microbacteriaceae bacterium SG_E_30_P1]|uniref:Uncharacterized protein n=1 Tax=Antiquaquibacter oligotrophicus TaxID=2880260 RepID=A0ABT6KK62_9MICO|nr:hypothetical protein [Antiquaquibacter oligotrophicus]MDH6180397.1 hypothetical protein [Antiquaquibacter oligotrophicus]UDF13862.1 hypothetical protein LH407_03120 [Antiquaquibacter oligotrophicus]